MVIFYRDNSPVRAMDLHPRLPYIALARQASRKSLSLSLSSTSHLFLSVCQDDAIEIRELSGYVWVVLN